MSSRGAKTAASANVDTAPIASDVVNLPPDQDFFHSWFSGAEDEVGGGGPT